MRLDHLATEGHSIDRHVVEGRVRHVIERAHSELIEVGLGQATGLQLQAGPAIAELE